MKNTRKNLMIIFLLLTIVLTRPKNIEMKQEEPLVDVLLFPEAMGVYEKWNYTTGSITFSSPIIADLNKDGFLEILIGSSAYVYCLNKSGYEEWNFHTMGDVRTSPI
jgi:hypothetical protein